MKHLLFFILIIAAVIPLTAQEPVPAGESPEAEKPAAEESVLSDQVYREIILEDFETNNYDNTMIAIKVTKDQKVELQIRDQYPAPVKGSKKYIGVKVYGKQGDNATITLPKPLIIKDYCQSISMWVYGKKFSGELSLVVTDADEKVHKLSYDKLNFLGWRKLTVRLTKDIIQEDKYLSQAKFLKITKIIYNPGSTERLGQWNYFYIDDISAKVREKYKDLQNDEW